MSFLKRFWNVIRNPVSVLPNCLGNTFYETRSLNDPTITKRTVQYSDPEDVWKYIGGGRRLAIQWSAWLTHTRKHPPTIQELQADMARRQRVLANAAIIEARDRAESEQMLRIRQQGAQQALEDAASATSARSLSGPETESTPATAGTTTPAANATASSPEGAATETSIDSTSKESTEKIKVLPPAFLTPSTPRKSKSSAPFALPSLQEAEAKDTATREQQLGSGEHKKASQPSPWRSKAVPETESWTPKARSRG
ncbi:hypothetical protein BJ912DRAFT_850177 [Pholiota molesta]|nr:hypothetical protein BJ912DRAFT_850177 [Pholiota molesta]